MARPNQKKPKSKKDKKLNPKGAARSRVIMVHPDVNKSKTDKLVKLRAAYAPYADECIVAMLAARRWGIERSEYNSFFPGSTTLTSHTRHCAREQANGIVLGWIESIHTNQLRAYITEHRDDFTDDECAQLYTIGLDKITVPGPWGKHTIEQRMIDLYWSWVFDENITGKRPCFGNNGMLLGQECVSFDAATDAKGLGSHWISVSCDVINKNTRFKSDGRAQHKRTMFPLADHPCLRNGASLAKTVLAQQRSDGRWVMRFTEYVPHVVVLPPDAPKVAVDVGKNTSAATSDGRFWGGNFSMRFDELWKEIKSTRANRHRQKLMEDSERLHALECKLTAMMKTAMGMVANQLVEEYDRYIFILEDLHLSGTRGQKRFAYKLLQRMLEQKACTQKENPAYTSQECPSCIFISRKNRHGITFHCICCGRTSHADYVGARNLLRRSEDKQIECDTKVAEVRTELRRRYYAARHAGGTADSPGVRVTRRRTTGRPDAQGLASAKAQRGEASNSSTDQKSVGAERHFPGGGHRQFKLSDGDK